MLETLHHFSNSFAAFGTGLLGAGMFGGMQLVFMVIGLLIFGYPFFVIATRLGHATPWFAFIPILNFVLLVQLADLEMWWVIVCIICFPVYIWPIMKICEKIGKPSWIGILTIVPCIGIFVPYYMAFG